MRGAGLPLEKEGRLSKEEYENYVPSHLDDPKYVGNFEMNKVVAVVLTSVASAVALIKGQAAVGVVLMVLTTVGFKLKSKYGQYFDGFLYWYLGFCRLPGKELEKAREFGVVPTYVKDFEE